MSSNAPGSGAPNDKNLWTTSTSAPGSFDQSIAPGAGTAGMSPGLYTAVSGYVRGSEFGGVLTSQWGLYAPLYLGVGQNLPAQASNGQVAYCLVDAAASVVWQFVYFGASQQGQVQGQGFTGFPWIFVGGPPLVSQVPNNDSTTSTAFVDLANIGPQISVPFSGDYSFQFGFRTIATAGTGPFGLCELFDLTAAGTPQVGNQLVASSGNSTANLFNINVSRFDRITSIGAGHFIRMRYAVLGTGANVQFTERFMFCTPIRVAGG